MSNAITPETLLAPSAPSIRKRKSARSYTVNIPSALRSREWVRICELEKPVVEQQSVENWIEIDRELDPNWTEEKSKALYQCKEEWLKSCTERLNEARANLSAAEVVEVRYTERIRKAGANSR